MVVLLFSDDWAACVCFSPAPFLSVQGPAQAKQAKEEAWQEQQRIAADKRLTWKQKEKRKRELGQAKGGKGNYVEEEKRVAREFGMYSGFDT